MDKLDELIARTNMLPNDLTNTDILQALDILNEALDEVEDIWDNIAKVAGEKQNRQYKDAMRALYE